VDADASRRQDEVIEARQRVAQDASEIADRANVVGRAKSTVSNKIDGVKGAVSGALSNVKSAVGGAGDVAPVEQAADQPLPPRFDRLDGGGGLMGHC